MKIKIVWLSYYPEVPRKGYWDMTMLSDIINRQVWIPVNAYEFIHCHDLSELEKGEGAIVVIPARYHHKNINRINKDLAKLEWVILMLVGDEESLFPADKISHPNIKLWLQTPVPGRYNAYRFLILGYTPDTRPMLSKYPFDLAKTQNWFFAGQITNPRREEFMKQLDQCEGGRIYGTKGFANGMPHEDYYKNMVDSKIIPCPSGPATPDSFRVAEALEAGCIPIADELTPNSSYPAGYWRYVFGQDPPFPTIKDWASLPGYMHDILIDWPANANNVGSWWMNYKRNLTYRLEDDVKSMSGFNIENDDINDLVSVVMPTSPVPSHPNMDIIDNTIKSIRHWLPRAEIFIMCDWIRKSQSAQYWCNYTEYTKRLIWRCNHEWTNILPIVFNKHTHQAAMTRDTLSKIKTPLLLFVEHDTPIVVDKPIDWRGLAKILLSGNADMIRLHYDVDIHKDHKYLMLDKEPVDYDGVPLIRTIQWSQRPHLATVSFYRRILANHFSPNARTMIEDRMYSLVEQNHRMNPKTGWYQYRLMIYAPEGNMQRSYHTDARGKDSKFEHEFIY